MRDLDCLRFDLKTVLLNTQNVGTYIKSLPVTKTISLKITDFVTVSNFATNFIIREQVTKVIIFLKGIGIPVKHTEVTYFFDDCCIKFCSIMPRNYYIILKIRNAIK